MAELNGTQIPQCYERIKPYIHRTPVLTSRLINTITGAEVYFKCENFQRMGAYKMRGATHALLSLSEEERQKGVVTHSSGNFAQALSLAAKALGVEAHIVMPSTAPDVKKKGVVEYGGKIYECEPTLEARNAAANEIQERTGAAFLHPSNDPDVILGQGTAAYEFLQDHPDLDYILTPVGGGGLIAGTALAAAYLNPKVEVIGTEPFAVDDAYRSLKSGKIEGNTSTNTIADGLKTQLGSNTFPVIRKYVKRIIRVEEEEIVEAMRLIWERMKIIVEPSSAVALAGLQRESTYFKGKKVGIIISGGNVDLARLPF
ncbi:threonine dehydratase [Muriicola jejuensis]|uniref:Pyridoxal-phosphate dependent enzyme n=1 Tax=Muriicola jejuensis TaxID=504488 RepID=A0A6P0UCN0_9FLAO|nr:pyridoxal-phosphate dependent enzyme [Muriicola jejuensis]NER10240.1 pyridoxal-phosphate dependent enzyme [Muriicola jejuensis]SMP01821.1 threonine dehydratase [Muriicola jejuensis]